MANVAAARTDKVNERILFAVHICLDEIERLSARLALEPQLVAARGPKDELALLEGLLHRILVGVGDKDYLLGVDILDGYGYNSRIAVRRACGARIGNLLADLFKLCEIERQLECFFYLSHKTAYYTTIQSPSHIFFSIVLPCIFPRLGIAFISAINYN